MSKYGMIATWRMAYEGLESVQKQLSLNELASKCVEDAIVVVEDYPYYKSVGYGGLPNEDCIVELDAAFMNGDTLEFGALASIRDFANPIKIAKKLSKERYNSFLVGEGAIKYAKQNNFEEKTMLTSRAEILYANRKKEIKELNLTPYDGHDTVCILATDNFGSVCAGTSTSGLFMKKSGRAGDSPVSGSGLYANSDYGAASATGLGEDIMKTCVSFETVRYMKEGYCPQDAVDKAVSEANDLLIKKYGKAGDISVVCINNQGEYGAATNTNEFSYVAFNSQNELNVYLVNNKKVHQLASKEWLENYSATRHAKVELN